MTPGDGHGRIGITLCPGKTDPNGMSGAWARDLDTDLDAIQRWGATAVVTLIEEHEFDLLDVHGLPEGVRDRHMEWWHLPIQDGKSPPAQGFEDGRSQARRSGTGCAWASTCSSIVVGVWGAPEP